MQGLGLNFIKLSWDITGPVGSSLSACAFTLQGSQDGTNFGTTHDTVPNCTADGQNKPIAVSGATSQLRINVSSFTSSGGAPVLSVTIAAWDEIIGSSTTDPLHVFTSPDTGATASLANSPTAVTFTNRNLSNVLLVNEPVRWSTPSAPAVGSVATATIAAEAGVRHVADCITFSASSIVAPALTQVSVALRDGASGAGNVLAVWLVVIPASTGQNVLPFGFCGLNLAGTTNTAMTLEFTASVANVAEAVALTGYNVN